MSNNAQMNTTALHIAAGEWQSHDAAETFALGRQIGEQLSGGEILLLDGPLGAGKTVMVKGIASALNVDPQEVTSPSFTLVNPHAGRLPLFHVDLYRLEEGPRAAGALLHRHGPPYRDGGRGCRHNYSRAPGNSQPSRFRRRQAFDNVG